MGLGKGSKNILIRRVHDVDQIYQQRLKGATVEIRLPTQAHMYLSNLQAWAQTRAAVYFIKRPT